MLKKVIIFGFLVLFLVFSVSAGDVKVKGYVQTWFSFSDLNVDADADPEADTSVFGFSLRRIRFAPYGTFGDNIKWGITAMWDKQNPGVLDAYLDIKLEDAFKVKIGQFAVGAKAGALTSSSALDLVERAQVVQAWSSHHQLQGYRALGLQVHGSFNEDKIYYALMIANPKTLDGLFKPGVKSSEYTHANNGLSLWARIETRLVEGLNIGGFYGTTTETDTDMLFSSYGFHLYYIKDNINAKVEYIGGDYGLVDVLTKYNGLCVLFGYKVNKFEPVIRYDFYTPNSEGFESGTQVEKYNNISLGVNFYMNKNVKFQLNYIVRDELMKEGFDKIKNNIFYINFQYKY